MLDFLKGLLPSNECPVVIPRRPLNPAEILKNEEDDDRPYADKTPDDKPMRPIRGTSAQEDPDDGSIWDKDRAGHGGSKWKRWPNKRKWRRNEGRESVRPDGSVR